MEARVRRARALAKLAPEQLKWPLERVSENVDEFAKVATLCRSSSLDRSAAWIHGAIHPVGTCLTLLSQDVDVGHRAVVSANGVVIGRLPGARLRAASLQLTFDKEAPDASFNHVASFS
jgi:hypothetical protein